MHRKDCHSPQIETIVDPQKPENKKVRQTLSSHSEYNMQQAPSADWQMSDDKGPKVPKKGGKRQEGVEVLERVRTKKPKMYRVIIHNDHYTTQEFVVHILTYFFRKDPTEAYYIMLKAHTADKAVVGVYTKDLAETRVTAAENYARDNGHPLMLTIEPED